ncbi:MAG: RHS repeat-associated core domain-containing protein, partial [Firmicutes bacterium]|nr:RHS repeat-associated core domain-containing protein [Bacillota bacterium]
FTARPFDPDSQLQDNLNRWYDAYVGRWLSDDPIAFASGDANLYRYCYNKSLTRIDPSGLSSATATCIKLVDALRGNKCASLEAFCCHIARHPGDYHKHWLKMCLSLHNAVCLGKGASDRITKAALRAACKSLYD